MLSKEDKEFLDKKHISEETLNYQLKQHRNGFPFLRLAGAAAPGKGILVTDAESRKLYLEAWTHYLNGEHRVQKFVPASGAASRMFKNLFEFLDGESDVPETDFLRCTKRCMHCHRDERGGRTHRGW